MIFDDKIEYRDCPHCGYRITKPFPPVCPNPRCLKPLTDTLLEAIDEDKRRTEAAILAARISAKIEKHSTPTATPSAIKVSKATAAGKIKGVRVKKKTPYSEAILDEPIIVIPRLGQYFKNFGIVTENRTVLFNRNSDYEYLLELGNNLDYIAGSIMGGDLEKLILKSMASRTREKVLYIKSGKTIYFLYGMFPDKQGYWILRNMKREMTDLLHGRDPDSLSAADKALLNRRFGGRMKYIMTDYLKLTDVITPKEPPSVEDTFKVHYIGMSFRSIGTISKLIGEELPIEMPPNMDLSEDDFKESLITAKIEAIAANTIANTKAIPIYISVKLGYERRRYIIFEPLPNDYFLYIIGEGNPDKFATVKEMIIPVIMPLTRQPFSGDLSGFVKAKNKLAEIFRMNVF